MLILLYQETWLKKTNTRVHVVEFADKKQSTAFLFRTPRTRTGWMKTQQYAFLTSPLDTGEWWGLAYLTVTLTAQSPRLTFFAVFFSKPTSRGVSEYCLSYSEFETLLQSHSTDKGHYCRLVNKVSSRKTVVKYLKSHRGSRYEGFEYE